MRSLKKLNSLGKTTVYRYPYHRKLLPAPTITSEMVAFSYKVGIVQAADRYNVPTYYLLKARNEHNLRKN